MLNFSFLAEAWLSSKRHSVKTTSYATYENIVKKVLLPYFQKKNETLSEEDVQSFVDFQIARGIKQKTVKDEIVVLKMIYRFAAKRRHCQMIDLDWMLCFPPTPFHNTDKSFSVSEHRKLLKYVSDKFSFRNFAVEIAIETGLRIGELCALQWSDFDMKDKVVRIWKTVYKIHLENGLYCLDLGTPKTRKSIREIPLSACLYPKVKAILMVTKMDYFVVDNTEKPTDPRNLREYFQRMCRRIGLPRMHFHCLRHSFATRCIESGVDYKTVSSLLGHANISTTLNLYVHPDREQKRKAVAKLLKTLL
ncbi:MAG: site-specific integrase [Bacteroidales bacterium]|nr:site-specific integrase [Bacteroidales bacterium]